MNDTNAGGEEWRRLDKGDDYQPERWDTLLTEAKASIEGHRKRDCELRLCDRQGRPLAGLTAEAVQTTSPFLWGEQTWALDRWFRDGSVEEHGKKAWMRAFANVFTAANCLHYWTERPRHDGPKSEETQGYCDYEHLQMVVDWANANGLVAKGHPIFWPVPKAIPDWIQDYDQETRLKFLEVRVRTIAARFRGKIRLYDAVNEPMWEPCLANVRQRQWPHMEDLDLIADDCQRVLSWARSEDPDACFLVNEYGILRGDHEAVGLPGSDGSTVTHDSQLDRYIAMLARLVERGAAPDAVGLQSHTRGWGAHDLQQATYDAIAEGTGLPVHITEFWARTNHLEDAGMPQAEIHERLVEYIGNYCTIAFASEHVESFFFWGAVGQMIDLRPNGGWELTPVYHGLRRLLRETWRTRSEIRTDGDGIARLRGFHGDYVLRFSQHGAGHTSSVPFHLAPGQGQDRIDLVLPHPPTAGGA